MTYQERLFRNRRPSHGRFRPSLDQMEARLALSAGNPILPDGLGSTSFFSSDQSGSPIALVDPAPNSVVEQSPSVISVTFAHSLNDFSIGVADFRLVRVADDGTLTPIMGPQGSLTEELDFQDPTGSRILLTPGAPLSNGRYQLLLSADNFLLTSDNQPITTGGVDLAISSFTIGRRPIEVIDLGQAGPIVRSTDGILDLATNPGAVGLYRLSIPAGHHWRLGLSVTTPDGRAPSLTVLSLFDAQGNLIDSASGGHAGSVGDPYLFDGVSPGTYLVGISGPGNIPGTPTGYDPASGLVGTSETGAIGGPFRLSFVADSADLPTSVTGVRVDRGDAHSTVPTGLTIQFSGTIQVKDLLSGVSPATLVDSSGVSWDMTPIAYDETNARLSFLFNQPLPLGRYTLKVADGGSLVDLAGLVPRAPGFPAGVLGNIEIVPGSTRSENLGALLPGVASAGLSTTVQVAAGGSIIRHFQVFQPGIYTISMAGGPTRLTAALTNQDGTSIELSPNPDGSAEVDGYLLAGSYTLELTNPSDSGFQGTLTVSQKSSSNESLLLGGIAQGPALNLRLIAPTASLGPVITEPVDTAPESGVLAPPIGSPSIPPANSPGSPNVTTYQVSSGVHTRTNTENYSALVGRPLLVAQRISVVGPSGVSGSVALASNSDSLPGGLVVVPKKPHNKLSAPGQGYPQLAGPREIPTETGNSTPEIDYGLISRDASPGTDQQVLDAAVAWIDRIAALGFERLEFLSGRTTSPVALTLDETTEIPSFIDGEDPDSRMESPQIEIASIAPAVGFGVLGMIAYRSWRGARMRSRQTRPVEVKTSDHPLFSGLHKPRAGKRRSTSRSGY
ncbi:hypothetical protein P12x_005165 [Tundrisphaera lichenicola]|uniref:hypothetical protein n=1 Tax=Tundrisphaera lichenicola TaxID=2029860 RepID=UPI003EBD65A2